MRRSIFIVLLIFSCCMIFAQSKSIKAGDLMIGGSLNGGIETGTVNSLDANGNEIAGTKFNLYRIAIDMEAGYFIANNLEIGPHMSGQSLYPTHNREAIALIASPTINETALHTSEKMHARRILTLKKKK
jgi:hypothetical protein